MRAQTRSHAIKRLIKKCVFEYNDDDERQGTLSALDDVIQTFNAVTKRRIGKGKGKLPSLP